MPNANAADLVAANQIIRGVSADVQNVHHVGHG